MLRFRHQDGQPWHLSEHGTATAQEQHATRRRYSNYHIGYIILVLRSLLANRRRGATAARASRFKAAKCGMRTKPAHINPTEHRRMRASNVDALLAATWRCRTHLACGIELKRWRIIACIEDLLKPRNILLCNSCHISRAIYSSISVRVDAQVG